VRFSEARIISFSKKYLALNEFRGSREFDTGILKQLHIIPRISPKHSVVHESSKWQYKLQSGLTEVSYQRRLKNELIRGRNCNFRSTPYPCRMPPYRIPSLLRLRFAAAALCCQQRRPGLPGTPPTRRPCFPRLAARTNPMATASHSPSSPQPFKVRPPSPIPIRQQSTFLFLRSF